MAQAKHIDHWREIRHPIKLRIELELQDGATMSVTTVNISSGGLQFRCDSWTADKIEPRGVHFHSLDHIKLNIRSEKHQLFVQGQIVFAERLSQNEFVIGVNFTNLNQTGKDAIKKLLPNGSAKR